MIGYLFWLLVLLVLAFAKRLFYGSARAYGRWSARR
jgi:hypothetical protein